MHYGERFRKKVSHLPEGGREATDTDTVDIALLRPPPFLFSSILTSKLTLFTQSIGVDG